jgi:hypothetical protein
MFDDALRKTQSSSSENIFDKALSSGGTSSSAALKPASNPDEPWYEKAWSWANTPLSSSLFGWPEEREGAGGFERGVEHIISGLTSPLSVALGAATFGTGGLITSAGETALKEATIAGGEAAFSAADIAQIAKGSKAALTAYHSVPDIEPLIKGTLGVGGHDLGLLQKAREFFGPVSHDADLAKPEFQDILAKGGFDDAERTELARTGNAIKAVQESSDPVRQAVAKAGVDPDLWARGQKFLHDNKMDEAALLGGDAIDRGAFQILHHVAPDLSLGTTLTAARTAKTLMNTGFTLQQLEGAAAMSPRFFDALKEGDYDKAAEYGTEWAANAVLGVAGASHALHSWGELAEPVLGSKLKPSDEQLRVNRMAGVREAEQSVGDQEGINVYKNTIRALGYDPDKIFGMSKAEKAKLADDLERLHLTIESGKDAGFADAYRTTLRRIPGLEEETRPINGLPTGTPVTQEEIPPRANTKVVFSNANGEVRVGSDGRPVVWMSPEAWSEFETSVGHKIEGVSYAPDEAARVTRRMAFEHPTGDLFRAAQFASEKNLVTAVKSSAGILATSEELHHSWQRELSQNGDVEKHLDPQQQKRLYDIIPKGMSDHLDNYDYSQDPVVRVAETAAKFRAGRIPEGVAPEEVAKWLTEYEKEIEAKHGPGAYEPAERINEIAKQHLEDRDVREKRQVLRPTDLPDQQAGEGVDRRGSKGSGSDAGLGQEESGGVRGEKPEGLAAREKSPVQDLFGNPEAKTEKEKATEPPHIGEQITSARKIIHDLGDKPSYLKFKSSLRDQLGKKYSDHVKSLQFIGPDNIGNRVVFKGEDALKKVFETAKQDRIAGAPPQVVNDKGYETLIQNLMDMAKTGEGSRRWYDESSADFLSMAGGDPLEAHRLAVMSALYSPRTSVLDNGRRAILAHYDSMQNRSISAPGIHPDIKAMAERIGKAKTHEELSSVMRGMKTSAFQNNLINLFDPEHANDDMATIDIHMMRALGYTKDAPNASQYEWAENAVRDVAQRMGWNSPKEAQAAIWVAQKMARGVTEAESRVGYGDAARKISGSINVEGMPGEAVRKTIFPGIDKATRPQLEQYHADKMAIVRDTLKKAGVLLTGEDLGHGYWADESNPVTSFKVPLPHIGSATEHVLAPSALAEIDRAAKLVLDTVGDQDAIGWSRTFEPKTTAEANGMHFALNRELTHGEMLAVSKRLESSGIPAFIDASDPKNLKVINYDWNGTLRPEAEASMFGEKKEVSTKESSKLAGSYHNKIRSIITHGLPDNIDARETLFHAESGLVEKGNENGQSIPEGSNASGSPVAGSGNVLSGRQQIEALNESYRKRYGWGTEDPNDRGATSEKVGEPDLRRVYHWSKNQFTEADPNFAGTGIRGAERMRQQIPGTHFGEENYREPAVQRLPNKYYADVDYSKVYDREKDPLDLSSKAANLTRDNGEPFGYNLETLIKDAGYKGYRAQNVLKYFEKVPVQQEGVRGSRTANATEQTVGTTAGAKADTDFFAQAKAELGTDNISAIAKRAQELKESARPNNGLFSKEREQAREERPVNGLPENLEEMLRDNQFSKKSPGYQKKILDALDMIAEDRLPENIRKAYEYASKEDGRNWEIANRNGQMEEFTDNHVHRKYLKNEQGNIVVSDAKAGKFATNTTGARRRSYDTLMTALLKSPDEIKFDPAEAISKDRAEVIKAAANRKFISQLMSSGLRASDGRPVAFLNGAGNVVAGENGKDPKTFVDPNRIRKINVDDKTIAHLTQSGDLQRFLDDGTIRDITPYVHPDNIGAAIDRLAKEALKSIDRNTYGEGGNNVLLSQIERLKEMQKTGDYSGLKELNDMQGKRYAWSPQGYVALDHNAMRGWNFVANSPDGNQVLVNTDVMAHPEYAEYLKNRLGLEKGALSKSTVGRAILSAGTAAKQTLLSLSPFHLVQIGLRGIMTGVNPFTLEGPDIENGAKIDPSDPNSPTKQRKMVEQGLTTGRDFQSMQEYTEGLSSGNHSLLRRVPVVGPILADSMQWQTDFLFKRFLPAIKATAAEKLFDDYQARYPEWSVDKVARAAGQHANDSFGGVNWKAMGRNATTQEFARAVLLAPDWLESELRSGARLFNKDEGAIGRRQVVIMAGSVYLLARALNALTTGNPHYEAPFDLATKSKDGKETLWGIRMLPSDLLHLASSPAQFVKGRLSPGVGLTQELLSGRDKMGRKMQPQDLWVDAVRQLMPIPVQSIGQAITNTGPAVGNVGQAWKALGGTARTYATPAQQKAVELAATHGSDGFVDPVQQARHRAVMGLEDRLRSGDIAWPDLVKMTYGTSQLTEAELKKIQNNIKSTTGMPADIAHLYSRASRLPAKEFLDVWDTANITEQKALQPLLLKTEKAYLRKTAKDLTPEQRQQDPTFQRLLKMATGASSASVSPQAQVTLPLPAPTAPVVSSAAEYPFTATHASTGHRIGSHDGKTWYDHATGEPLNA